MPEKIVTPSLYTKNIELIRQATTQLKGPNLPKLLCSGKYSIYKHIKYCLVIKRFQIYVQFLLLLKRDMT